MSIQTRLPKINQVVSDGYTRLVYKRDKSYRVYSVKSVRTSDPFQVIAQWLSTDTLFLNLFDLNPKVEFNHPANQAKTICYQCLAIAKKMAKEAGKVLSFCKSYDAAQNLLRLGGKLIKLVNPAGSIVWCTIR